MTERREVRGGEEIAGGRELVGGPGAYGVGGAPVHVEHPVPLRVGELADRVHDVPEQPRALHLSPMPPGSA
ncbi:hypothetical protein LWC35_17725 [Pseudonocardia kujensis]|uniref:hypothetical protein n=1 Tax=Pseudonocardia kujensis TaxID=1128675 RepID=UPI001E3E3F5B|nr:hypothetical protein [Pseudonocardia kujensis]MCE0764733.1 hypothetical protein [Pseudonocardia kujensis]